VSTHLPNGELEMLNLQLLCCDDLVDHRLLRIHGAHREVRSLSQLEEASYVSQRMLALEINLHTLYHKLGSQNCSLCMYKGPFVSRRKVRSLYSKLQKSRDSRKKKTQSAV